MAEEISISQAVDFIVRAQHSKPVNKVRLKEMVKVVNDVSVKTGLQESAITKLVERVLITQAYDASTRRKLLFCCIPTRSASFPYPIIPILLSNIYPAIIDKPNDNKLWYRAVLSWLWSLLHYSVVNTDNVLVRMCYLPCFNMLSVYGLARVTSAIVCCLTRRVDVTPNRVDKLLQLTKRKGLVAPYTPLLRKFNVLRPDLLVIGFTGAVSGPAMQTMAPMVPALDSYSRRHRSTDEDNGTEDLWSSAYKRYRVNPYLRNTVLPPPTIVQWAATLDEQKAERVNVMQYKSMRELTKVVSRAREWQWPCNAASMLRNPLLLLAFRPHHYHVQLALESWLDHAINSELLSVRNTERSCSLLRCVTVYTEHQLIAGRQCSPVVQQFLMTYLLLWDQQIHLQLVLRLVRCVGYIEPFMSVVVSRLSPLLVTSSVSVACAVVGTFAETVVNWCLHYRATNGGVEDCGFSLIEGALELTRILDSHLLAAVLHHSAQPILMHSILHYYSNINNCCESLRLPLAVCPSPPMIATLVSTEDLATQHHAGLLLSRLPAAYSRLRTFSDGPHQLFVDEIFKETELHNSVVKIYISYCYDGSALATEDDVWSDLLEVFLGVRGVARPELASSVLDSLHTAAIKCRLLDANNNNVDVSKDMHALRDDVLTELQRRGIDGITRCVDKNKLDIDESNGVVSTNVSQL